jgi:hypothetical protein
VSRRSYSRAILTIILSEGKLLSTLPWVLDPKKRKPEIPIAKHITRETAVE